MEIIKINDDILKKGTDNQRKQAKKTIEECIKNGVGVYEIKDNENIYPSKQIMFERLKQYAGLYHRHLGIKTDNGLQIEVITRNKKQQILVIVKE